MPETFPWEDALFRIVSEAMPPGDQTHNADHARLVAKRAREIRSQPEFVADPHIDDEALIAGAYLHDIGYCAPEKMVSVDSYEHIEEGVAISRRVLADIGFDPAHRERVIYLVRNHDNAKWSIPNWDLPGHGPRLSQAEIEALEASEDEGLQRALLILKEADSAEYTDLHGTERTWAYCEAKGIAIQPEPSYARALNADRLSNLLIFPHLAWLNATTEKGKRAAALGYLRAEQWVYDYCKQYGIAYEPDAEAEEVRWALRTIPDEVAAHFAGRKGKR